MTSYEAPGQSSVRLMKITKASQRDFVRLNSGSIEEVGRLLVECVKEFYGWELDVRDIYWKEAENLGYISLVIIYSLFIPEGAKFVYNRRAKMTCLFHPSKNRGFDVRKISPKNLYVDDVVSYISVEAVIKLSDFPKIEEKFNRFKSDILPVLREEKDMGFAVRKLAEEYSSFHPHVLGIEEEIKRLEDRINVLKEEIKSTAVRLSTHYTEQFVSMNTYPSPVHLEENREFYRLYGCSFPTKD